MQTHSWSNSRYFNQQVSGLQLGYNSTWCPEAFSSVLHQEAAEQSFTGMKVEGLRWMLQLAGTEVRSGGSGGWSRIRRQQSFARGRAYVSPLMSHHHILYDENLPCHPGCWMPLPFYVSGDNYVSRWSPSETWRLCNASIWPMRRRKTDHGRCVCMERVSQSTLQHRDIKDLKSRISVEMLWWMTFRRPREGSFTRARRGKTVIGTS